MGSSSSSSSSSSGKNSSCCQCAHDNSQKVYKVRWIRVPLGGAVADYGYDIFRGVAAVATLGISTWYNGGLKDSSHECIEIHFKCDECGNNAQWTLEFGSYGKRFGMNYYSTEYGCQRCFKTSNLTFGDVGSLFDEMCSSNYSLTDNNCCHWSSELYWKLYNKS